ncbi:MAG: tRNA (adenosine(37)-N6)-dimethylallyltransferase MiaA [Desulfovibrionales bacterium]
MAEHPPIPVVCLAGSTGTGKTAFSLSLAERFRGSIINFDSRQVYKHFPIVTAQPTEEEQSLCPHHLYGFLEPDRSIDAGGYAQLAADVIRKVHAEGRLPVLVGGTGLYLRALLEGIAPIPAIDPAVRAAVQDRWGVQGGEALYEELKSVDPKYAARIHPHDRQRITRALEVFESTEKPFTMWHRERIAFGNFRALKLGIRLPLDELAPRLRFRIDAMLAAGALDEIRRAWELCPDPEAPAWSGIGCHEILQHLLGLMPLDQAVEEWLKSTRRYAKRQTTWFRREKDMHWVEPGRSDDVIRSVSAWL